MSVLIGTAMAPENMGRTRNLREVYETYTHLLQDHGLPFEIVSELLLDPDSIDYFSELHAALHAADKAE